MSNTTNGSTDIPVFNEERVFTLFKEMAHNALLQRQEFFRNFMDPRRNVYEECGYPAYLDAFKYRDLYEREAIAARVVQVYPLETWQVQPEVYEDEDNDEVTDFEAAWDNMAKEIRIRGERSYYQDESGSVIWEYLRRVDILSGIGQYGIILLGLDDGQDLSTPVKGVEERNSVPAEKNVFVPNTKGIYNLTTNLAIKERKLLYIRVFAESSAPIMQFESNPSSPRFGQPVIYQITFNDERSTTGTSVGAPQGSFRVHWTRIVHIADNLESSEVFGPGRIRPVLNNVLGLQKLYCGSPEMYWKGAFYGVSFETHPQLGGQVKIDREAIKNNLEEYFNGLQRQLVSVGMTAKTLAPTVVDPSPQIRTQIEAICIYLGIPLRVFMGSERGELASSQDDASWNDKLRARQRSYVTPRIVAPFVDRLIFLGVLPTPIPRADNKLGYSIWWPDLASQSAQEKAAVALTKTQALSTYVQSGASSMIVEIDFLTGWLGIDHAEAMAYLDNAAQQADKAIGESNTGSPLLGLVGGITGMIELFKLAKEGGLSEDQLKQQIMLFFKVSSERADEIIADGLPDIPEPPAPGEEVEEGEDPLDEEVEDEDEEEAEVDFTSNVLTECILNAEGVCFNCGGKGSGKPGPCPMAGGKSSKASLLKEAEAAGLVGMKNKSRAQIAKAIEQRATSLKAAGDKNARMNRSPFGDDTPRTRTAAEVKAILKKEASSTLGKVVKVAGKTSTKSPVKVKAATGKVAKIAEKVKKAQANLTKLKGELKEAKAGLKAVKVAVPKKISKAITDAKETANKLREIDSSFASKAMAGGRKKPTAPKEGEIRSAIDAAIGKRSVHAVAKELLGQRFKSVADARNAIYNNTEQRIGMILRAQV